MDDGTFRPLVLSGRKMYKFVRLIRTQFCVHLSVPVLFPFWKAFAIITTPHQGRVTTSPGNCTGANNILITAASRAAALPDPEP